MPTLDHGGTKLHFEESGHGDPPLVFVHGWTCDGGFFRTQFEHNPMIERFLATALLAG